MRITHQAWIELVTRKAALPFDSDYDVITDVYDSWYVLFGELRELAKSVPAERIRDHGSTKELVDALVKALNDGLRPHLTKWQARFRAWERLAADSTTASPQHLQRQYPEYDELLRDLLIVNQQLMGLARALDTIVYGSERSLPPK